MRIILGIIYGLLAAASYLLLAFMLKSGIISLLQFVLGEGLKTTTIVNVETYTFPVVCTIVASASAVVEGGAFACLLVLPIIHAVVKPFPLVYHLCLIGLVFFSWAIKTWSIKSEKS